MFESLQNDFAKQEERIKGLGEDKAKLIFERDSYRREYDLLQQQLTEYKKFLLEEQKKSCELVSEINRLNSLKGINNNVNDIYREKLNILEINLQDERKINDNLHAKNKTLEVRITELEQELEECKVIDDESSESEDDVPPKLEEQPNANTENVTSPPKEINSINELRYLVTLLVRDNLRLSESK